MPTLIEQLATFAAAADPRNLPDDVVKECRRILLDSLGCAIASLNDAGAQRGVAYGRYLGGHDGTASILGTDIKITVPAAAFANAELINALDQDPVLPPGHVTPYVLPGALATAESLQIDGATLLTAIAVAHEMSYRIGKATDYLRDVKDGAVTIPEIIGYSSTLFGATAAIGVVKGLSPEVLADALGIMGSTMPTNTQRAWMMHAPATTIKYQLAGGLALSAVTAANLAELGHTGDRQILDDRQYGFPRFIGTARWEPAPITADLSTAWTFPAFQSFKPYPHCRVMHALFDGLIAIVEDNDIAPNEIDAINAWGESFVMQPTWLNENIRNPRDAQFSMTHGLAIAAHRIPAGKDWQTPEAVLNPSVLELTKRTTFQAHPDYTAALLDNPAARRSRVEVVARGTTFTTERAYPKGSPSPEPSTYMTDAELIAKFRHNVEGVIAVGAATELIDAVRNLQDVRNVADLISLLRPGQDRNDNRH
jgi:2-methylcitrate dehydratase PrpD